MTVLLILMMLVVPLIFLWIGLLWEKHPPKKINWAYGYRKRRSSASQQAWISPMHTSQSWLAGWE